MYKIVTENEAKWLRAATLGIACWKSNNYMGRNREMSILIL